MNKNYKGNKRFIIIFSIIIILSLFFLWQNNDIVVTKINHSNPKIPDEFKGYKIAHISDLHNKRFGKNQKRLLNKIRKTSPDIIVITGDLIDRRKYNLDTAMTFIDGAIEICPAYYVSGNHEAWSGDYKNIKKELLNSNVKILDDEKVQITRDNSSIEILGLSDPDFLTSDYIDGTDLSKLEKGLETMSNDSTFQILLCHRPELFSIYQDKNIDLIFAGHAHGGQFRLPFAGGLVAPDQGLFPKYTSGAYEENGSTLVVSRGLGNSIIPIRIFNRPEIIVLTLGD